jgi:8-oxo-dGTP pyrophosphatase MutT (NUDIX family)
MKPFSIHLTPPEDFHATVEVAGCFISCDDRILYLHRHPEKPQGNTWGVPAGKMEKGENPRQAVIREIEEEIGITLDDHKLKEHGSLYCRLGHLDYIFHVFSMQYATEPALHLAEDEHLEAAWVTPAEALQLPLIVGGAYALDFYLQTS